MQKDKGKDKAEDTLNDKMDYKCSYCCVELKSMSSYRYHCISKKHLMNVEQSLSKNGIIPSPYIKPLPEIKCNFCCKTVCNTGNLNRHKKQCKLNPNNLVLHNIGQDVLINPSNNITINVQQNITNNIINADTITNNIQITPDEIFDNFWKQAGVRPFGFEDLSGLDNQEIADKIHSFGLNCFVEFITQIYKNTLNHNISLYNKREKLVKYVHKSGEVKIEPLVSVMSSLLMNLVDYLDTYLDRADIQVKQQYLPIIKKLKDIHALEDNPHLDKYNTHLYNRILNFSNSAAEKIKAFEQKLELELCDKLKELELSIPRTDSRTEADIIAE